MHPSQVPFFRKTIIVLLTLGFTGSLLVFTSMANLDLLKTVYPDPQFYMFGLLCLEGGVVYWTGYYLMQASGIHKAMAVFSLAVDACFSGVGFFYEMEMHTKSVGTIQLPPITVIVAACVLFNVGMSIISHLIPTHQVRIEAPKADGEHVSLREGVVNVATSLATLPMEVQERVQERRGRSVTPQKSIDTERLEAVTEPKKQ